MSDSEEVSKKSGYRLEYSNGRAKCKGPKPCAGSKIDKGQIRVGSLVDFRGNTSYAWRHWGCTTAKIFENMKKSFDEADELDGFEELNDGDKEKVRAAWTAGHVADEDIPATARKADGDNEEEEDEEEEEEEAKPKKAAGKKTAAKKAEPTSTVFKFEYAGSARAKCKECSETIGKGFFRLGHEVDFRGNKTFAWQHFGCTPTTRVAQLVQAYDEASAVEGFSTLQDGDKEKVQRAWDAGAIPEDDKGPGEPIEIAKKKAVPRKKKDDDDEDRPKKKARKAKADDDEDEDMEEEKPKPKRAPAKKAAEKKEAPAKKRAPRKKKVEEEDEEDAEDFGDELANVSGDDEDEAEPSEDEAPKKRKRAPAKASSSKVAEKPASKATAKPASKSTKPPSKKAAAKPASSRGSRSKKPVDEDIDEEDDDE